MNQFTDAAGQPIAVGDYVAYGTGRGEISFGQVTLVDPLIFKDPAVGRQPGPPQSGYRVGDCYRESHATRTDRTTFRFPLKRVKHGPQPSDWHVEWYREHGYVLQINRLVRPGDYGTEGLSTLQFPGRLIVVPRPVWA